MALRLLLSAMLGEDENIFLLIFLTLFLVSVRVESGFVLRTNAQRSMSRI